MATARRLTLCLAAGMDKNMILSCRDDTRLHVAARHFSDPEEQEIFWLLLEHGADVHMYNQDEDTPLQVLVSRAPGRSLDTTYRKAFTMLLKHGADINFMGWWSGPLLHKATARERPGVVEILLKHGADPNPTAWMDRPNRLGRYDPLGYILPKILCLLYMLISERDDAMEILRILERDSPLERPEELPFEAFGLNNELPIVRLLVNAGARLNLLKRSQRKMARAISERRLVEAMRKGTFRVLKKALRERGL
jgi:hypothetical protein